LHDNVRIEVPGFDPPGPGSGVFNGVSGGQMLSRLVSALGTKTSSASWQLTLTQTWVLV